MLAKSILVATLASLLAVSNAAPVAQADDVTVTQEAGGTSTGGRQIKWRRESDGAELCLQVNAITGPAEAQLRNGGLVGANYCFGENDSNFPFQQWVYTPGSTTIRIAPNSYSDTQYCIDFGSNLGSNGQELKIWQCYDGLPAQQLYITDDNHIAVENGPGQCADVQAESGPQPAYARPYGEEKRLQTWDCSSGNPNQIFIFDGTTPTPPGPGPDPQPTGEGQPITWVGPDGTQLCLQVNPEPYGLGNGRGVGASGCVSEEFDYVRFQRWTYTRGSTKIRVATPDDQGIEYCIDFGTNLGANGQGLKIWQCYDGLPQQQLYITDDNHIAVENGPGQCADVRAESVPRPVRPYGIVKDLQSWECSAGNTNQIFGFA